MRSRCVVELTFGRLSSGSGYLLTPRHVLTARHVVKPEENGAPCTIAPLGVPGQPAPPEATGRAGWLSEPAPSGTRLPDNDFAIIEVDGAGWPDLADDRVDFGSVAADEKFTFQAVGFPEAAGNTSHPFAGFLGWELREGLFNLNVTEALPREAAWWAGVSGAAVFCGGVCVGVLRQVKQDFYGLLTATPVPLLLNNPEFQTYWSRQGMMLPEMRPVARLATNSMEQIAAQVFMIDRREPSEQIIRHLLALPSVTNPQAIMVPGLDDDEHQFLIQQLSCREEMQQFLEREAAVQDTIIRLPWPVEAGDVTPDKEFRLVVEALHSAARLPPPTGDNADVATLRQRFDDGVTPRAFWVLGRRAIAFGGHSELLRRLLELWQSLPAGRPVVLFLCLALDDPPKRAINPVLARLGFQSKSREPDPKWWDTIAAAINDGKITGLDPLSMIAQTHVDPWIEHLRRECRAAFSPEQFDGLRLGLLSRTREEKPLRRVAVDLDELLRYS